MSEPPTRPSSPSACDDDYRLTTSFPYLVRRVGLRIGELFDRAVAPYGVDVSMFRVMAALAEQDGQQLGQLAAVTTIELSTLSRLVGAMSAKGFLTRRRPRGNGRIVEITLSPKGRRLVDELVPIALYFEQAATAGITAAETQRIKAILDTAYHNLDQLEAELDNRDKAAPERLPRRRTARAAAVTSS